jgi:hypothetical protein
MKRVTFALAPLLLALPSVARAQDATPPPPPPVETASPPAEAPAPPLVVQAPAPMAVEAPPPVPEAPASDNRFWRIEAGFRGGLIGDSSFNPYASDEFIGQLSIEATRTLLARKKLSLAVGLAWDTGSRSSGIRGNDSSLVLHRFTAPIEGRYHFASWLFGFARVAPGAGFLEATVTDASSPATLSDNAWVFATDLSAGASVMLGPRTGKVHFWLTPEAGWGFMTEAKLSPTPQRNPNDIQGTDEAMHLPGLSMSGFFWRLTGGLSF